MNYLKMFGSKLSLMLVAFAFVFTSCGDDDSSTDSPVITPDDNGGGSLALGDGTYIIAKDPKTIVPQNWHKLVAEKVDGPDFGSQDRTDFSGGFMYLEAGEYNVAIVKSKAVTERWGGTLSKVDGVKEDSGCGFTSYQLVSGVKKDGDAFKVDAGFYKVGYDVTKTEIILVKIEQASGIGSSLDGWSSDVKLDMKSSTKDAVTFEGKGVNIKAGEMKLRFNCRWSVNRRDPADADISDASKGYQMFTNLGGNVLAPQIGGANIKVDDATAGSYTVTITFDKKGTIIGLLADKKDLPKVAFDRAKHNFGVIGDAALGWKDENVFSFRLLNQTKAGSDFTDKEKATHKWVGVAHLDKDAKDGFKLRAPGADVWLGGGQISSPTLGSGVTVTGSDNWKVSESGFYYFTLMTVDDGKNYTLSIDKASVGIIGDAAKGWSDGDDVALSYDAASKSLKGTTVAMKSSGGFKFRAQGAWDWNLGGALAKLEIDGGNLSVSADGNYTVTLEVKMNSDATAAIWVGTATKE